MARRERDGLGVKITSQQFAETAKRRWHRAIQAIAVHPTGARHACQQHALTRTAKPHAHKRVALSMFPSDDGSVPLRLLR